MVTLGDFIHYCCISFVKPPTFCQVKAVLPVSDFLLQIQVASYQKLVRYKGQVLRNVQRENHIMLS